MCSLAQVRLFAEICVIYVPARIPELVWIQQIVPRVRHRDHQVRHCGKQVGVASARVGLADSSNWST